jgi:two-component system phosphate regulon sensor histidine kinase PhoR
LASLKALVETLQEGALEDPPAANRFLSQMVREIDNLTQLVQELLELSRIESGKVPLNRTPIQPVDLLDQAHNRMALQAERAGISIVRIEEDNLPLVFADSIRISQVLLNLLHNAIKFTPPGGRITLQATNRVHDVVFSIQDTGVGIPSQDRLRIFERFYKTDRSRSGGGTGLGLSIAKHLVEAHGGHIWVESTEGSGSTFSFSIPKAN